jgi:uncharacterized protein YdeI (YjbR/CyaY-like superfamily)
MNTNPETYFTDGCGRCKFGGTPKCKVNNWRKELKSLRSIALDCGLQEESKWGVPCYTYHDKNILLISAFKNYCAISFFKGVLLNDSCKILDKPGENSQSTRLIKFTNIQQIKENQDILKAYIFNAIEVEKSGLKVEFSKNQESIPDELKIKMNELPEFKIAFEALTKGRQRGYILYFSKPKQSKTRVSRIEKYIPKILDGKGIND